MRSFLKILLACFTAIVLTLLILFFLGVSVFRSASEPDKPTVKSKTVLVLDLSKPIREQSMDAGINLSEGRTPTVMGLYDLVRAIRQAGGDSLVKGIYLKCRENASGFATSEELRNALIGFKKQGKFIIAASDYISQRAYEVANVADQIYCPPQGMVQWKGFAFQLVFFKNALEKLEIEPQIFYAGQFKSATEPFRLNKMSEPNRVQLTSFLDGLYGRFLQNTAEQRSVDTSELRELANGLMISRSQDALRYKLVDGVKYDDEVKAEISRLIKADTSEKINFMQLADYIKNGDWQKSNSNKIAIIYAEGEMVDGVGGDDNIGGDKFRSLVRKARLDEDIKAVVLRVNSPGGSAMAAEAIWREIDLCKKEKPVVVSMGDYAASGGYYISCNGDSVFAQNSTLTGSIGVFSMYFNAQQLFNNKLGISFDQVTTTTYGDYGSFTRPMTERERAFTQAGVDSIYAIFKKRVADGRKMAPALVDSIAQGRIWSGKDALALGLVDRLGNIQDAVDCAVRMAKLTDYETVEIPKVESFWQKLLGGSDDDKDVVKAYVLKEKLGAEEYNLLQQYNLLRTWSGVPQMRLPFFASIK